MPNLFTSRGSLSTRNMYRSIKTEKKNVSQIAALVSTYFLVFTRPPPPKVANLGDDSGRV